jgi:hypothetical protein
MINPPGYYASISELLIEIEKVVKASPPTPNEIVWRNEALVVLAHALAD